MTTEGWIFITLSWGTILTVAAVCFIRVLSKKQLK